LKYLKSALFYAKYAIGPFEGEIMAVFEPTSSLVVLLPFDQASIVAAF
jgi:hypothetical protein